MTLKPSEENEIKTNSRLLTGLFRIGQSVAALALMWGITLIYTEIRRSAEGQISITEKLSSIQTSLYDVQRISREDHDRLTKLETRVDLKFHNAEIQTR